MAGEKTLKDVVILGRAAPQEISRGRLTVCTGAWSKQRGFIRLYPCDPEEDLFRRWDKVNVDVKRNEKDNRDESWKLASRDQPSCVEKVGRYPREQRATLLTQVEDDCVEDIKETGRSLGIIRPKSIVGLEFQEWGGDDDTEQTRLIEEIEEWRPGTRAEFDQEIRIEFECPNCKTKQGFHNKTVLGWGGYVATKKHNLTTAEELEKFYDINDENYRHWIFVGNQNNYRSSYIAINIINMKDDVPIYGSVWNDYPKVSDNFKHPAEKV